MRKIWGIVFLCSFIFSYGFSDLDQTFSKQEKITKLKEVISLFNQPEIQTLFTEEDYKILQIALNYYEEDFENLGDQFLQFFLLKYEDILKATSVPFSSKDKLILTTYLFQQYPSKLLNALEKVIDAYTASIDSVYQLTKKARGIIETYEMDRNEKIDLASEELCAVLSRFKAELKNVSLETLQEFVLHQGSFAERVKFFLAAMINRNSTVTDRSKELQESLMQLIQQKYFFEDEAQLVHLKEIESKESKVHVIFNRHTTSAVGLASLLIGESLTWYLSGKANLSKTIKLATTLSVVGSTIVAGNSTLNIADRYIKEGGFGLLTWDTCVDFLLISALPWRSLKDLPDFFRPETWKSVQWVLDKKSIQWVKNTSPVRNALKGAGALEHFVWRKLVENQYDTGRYLALAVTGMGTWQIFHADELALDFKKRGIDISSNDIRKEGVFQIGIGLLGGLTVYNRSRAYVKAYSSMYEEAIASARLIGPKIKDNEALIWRWNRILNPISLTQSIMQHLKKTFVSGVTVTQGLTRNISSFSDAFQNLRLFTIGTANFLKNGFRLTLETCWVQSYMLLLFTYPDTWLMKNVDIPDLKEGEIALALNGFSPLDLLYYTSHFDPHHREELKKYVRGKNFFDVDYTSPKDFIQKIDEISQEFGKIKYLKISTHGLPGHLTSRDQTLDSFIDTEFLTKEEKNIKEISKKAFAPDARIVLISCLVGGNLEEDIEEIEKGNERIDEGNQFILSQRGQTIKKNESDTFIHALGNVLLVNGGRIDSSRNIVLALNGTYIALFKYLTLSSNYDEATRAKLMYDLNEIQIQIDKYNEMVKHLEQGFLNQSTFSHDKKHTENYNGEKVEKMAFYLVNRFVQMQLHMTGLIQKYGINLKGNLFSSRHRTDYFESHE